MQDEYHYKYDCLEDPYTYPGSQVLKNKFNIRNAEILNKVERQISEAKLIQIYLEGAFLRARFDLRGLQAMHKYLFGDLYAWAGEIRSAGFICKGESIFCHSDFIEPYAKSLFSRMNREDFSKMTQKECAKRLAFYLSEVNAIHPFREGNGRTTRLFFFVFARAHGWNFEIEKIPHEVLIDAMIESMNGSLEPLEAEIAKVLIRQ